MEDDSSDLEELTMEPPVVEPVKLGYIYRLFGTDGHFYYGSTQRTLARRFDHHHWARRLPPTRQQLVTRHFSNLGWEKVRIEPVQEVTSTRSELYQIERGYLREYTGKEFCLNDRMPRTEEELRELKNKYYLKKLAVKVTCECGEVVCQVSMPDHLITPKHERQMVMKTKPRTRNTDLEEVMCHCGDRVQRIHMAYHRTTEGHLWNLRLKAVGEVPVIERPPQIASVDGKPRCVCPCGADIVWYDFNLHVARPMHLRQMMERGLISIPEVQVIPESESHLPEGQQVCTCGEIIAITSRYFHIATPTHIAKMCEIESKLPPNPEPLPEKTVSPGSVKVECSCGITVCRAALTRHLQTDSHRQKLERKIAGIPEPPRLLARMKEKLTCVCGSVTTRGNMGQHLAKKKHIDWVAQHQAQELPAASAE